jgi:hypothetical protein
MSIIAITTSRFMSLASPVRAYLAASGGSADKHPRCLITAPSEHGLTCLGSPSHKLIATNIGLLLMYGSVVLLYKPAASDSFGRSPA